MKTQKDALPTMRSQGVQMLLAVVLAVAIAAPAAAGAANDRGPQDATDACLLRVLKTAGAETTVGEVRAFCAAEEARDNTAASTITAAGETSAIDARLKKEGATRENAFVITPHKPNYVLPVAYKSPNSRPYQNVAGEKIDDVEMKFQLSYKIQLFAPLLKKYGNLYFAYTNQSYWQAYNSNNSSPFRETNHEPEAFFTIATDTKILGFKNRLIAIGINHQSNGRSGDLSRSWNRLYASFIFEKDNLYFSIKPWYRLPESKETDDNQDINDYMGYGEFRAFYKKGRQLFGLLLRNNLDPGTNRGAVQLDWSFPLPGSDRVKGYLQYFNGYGESLIDYNAASNRIGLGFLLTDWL
jgi:phospholipase A1